MRCDTDIATERFAVGFRDPTEEALRLRSWLCGEDSFGARPTSKSTFQGRQWWSGVEQRHQATTQMST